MSGHPRPCCCGEPLGQPHRDGCDFKPVFGDRFDYTAEVVVLDTGALPLEHPVESWQDLCLFLGGDEVLAALAAAETPGQMWPTSFTGLLLRLIQMADADNLVRLRRVYPRHVAAFELWSVAEVPMPARTLARLLAARDQPVYCGGGMTDLGSRHAPHRWARDPLGRYCPGEPT